MKKSVFLLFLYACCLSCKKDTATDATQQESTAMVFDSEKWKLKNGADYPYRNQMLQALLKTDTIKTFKKEGILNLLGTPDKIDNNHLFYTVEQERLQFIPLHTTTLVIKLFDNDSVDWVKVHQ